jgi:hypothetical protein
MSWKDRHIPTYFVIVSVLYFCNVAFLVPSGRTISSKFFVGYKVIWIARLS